MPGLDDPTKARCRHHTGYPEVSAAPSLQFGLPKPMQLAFMLETAMNNVLNSAIPRVRDILQILDDLEQQMIDAQPQLAADTLGGLGLAGSRDPRGRLVTDRLENEYVRWAGRLADIFGVPLYPFSERFMKSRRGTTIPVR